MHGLLLKIRSQSSPLWRESEFADGRSATSPDSEQMEQTATMLLLRNSGSVENERAKSESGSVLV